ncbi:MAG: uracil-DNA glycosylase family protein [Pseudomonadota bacterium]
MSDASSLEELLEAISACRICVEQPKGRPLPHEPRPVLLASPTAKIAVCGQAPGTRVHASGVPFTDPSGDRLRAWMAVSEDEFYDTSRIAIVPMGFCFPGLDNKGGDLPPRKECAPRWREAVFEELGDIRLILVVGQYAQQWHLGRQRQANLTETVKAWRTYLSLCPAVVPLPHPSWRNNAWLKKNAWFGDELLPVLQQMVRQHLQI